MTEAQKKQAKELKAKRDALKNKKKPLGFKAFEETAPTETPRYANKPLTFAPADIPAKKTTTTPLRYNIMGVQVGVGKGQYASPEEAKAARKARDKVNEEVEKEPSSLQITMEELKKPDTRLKEDTASITERIRLQRQQAERERQQAEQTTLSSTAGIRSLFSESRMGVGSTANVLARDQGVEAIKQKFEGFKNQLEQNENLLKDREKALIRAREDLDEIAAKKIAAEISDIEQSNLAIQRELALAQDKEKDDLLNLIDKLGPETFATMNPSQVSGMFSGAGLSPSLGIAFQSASEKLATAQETKNEIEIAQAQATLDTTIAELNEVGSTKRTADQQKFNFMADMLGAGIITEKQFNNGVGRLIGEKPLTALETQLEQAKIDYKNMETDTGRSKIQSKIDAYTAYQAVGSNIIENIKGAVNGEAGGQCGRFVNNTIENPSFFKNTLWQKMSKINSYNPVPGSVFISSIDLKRDEEGEITQEEAEKVNGHCGMVEEVLEDGRLVVVDSNRYGGNEKITRRTVDMKTEKIEGFYNPADEMGEGVKSPDLPPEIQVLVDSSKNQTELNSKLKASGLDDTKSAILATRALSIREATPEDRNFLLKEMAIIQVMPTQLINSGFEREQLKALVKSFPEFTSTELKLRFALGEDYDVLDDKTKNVASEVLLAASGLPETFQATKLITQIKRGNFIAAINKVEAASVKFFGTNEDYVPSEVERRLKWFDTTLETVKRNKDQIGKADGLSFKALRAVGINNTDAQRLETMFDFINAPTRVSIAGTAVTPEESRKIKGIQIDITDPQENVLTKIETMNELLLEGYNEERGSAGLVNVDMATIRDDNLRVDLYSQGITLQKQIESKGKQNNQAFLEQSPEITNAEFFSSEPIE